MNILFDFDSTLVQAEGLDLLADICFQNEPSKVRAIEEITHLGMTGQMTLVEALQARIDILNASRSDIDSLVSRLMDRISPSIGALQNYFTYSSANMFVLSGGFEDYVIPIGEHIGFKKEHIFANKFVFNDDKITGFDSSILLSQSFGKAKTIRQLNLNGSSYLVGDGYTDLEVKLDEAVDYFIAFTETIARVEVVQKSDFICSDFYELIQLIQRLKNE